MRLVAIKPPGSLTSPLEFNNMKILYKKRFVFLAKAIVLIWCITFSIYWLISFMKGTGKELPESLEQYMVWYSNFLDSMLSGWFFELAFGIIFITVFIWIIIRSNKDMGWDNLSENYLLTKEKLKKLQADFIAGQSYMNDVYYNGIHIAFITQGIILRHPFPFNYLKPALLIPWNELDKIVIKRGLWRDNQKNLFNKISGKISPWKYADLKLSKFKNQTITIPWKRKLVNSIPEEARGLINN